MLPAKRIMKDAIINLMEVCMFPPDASDEDEEQLSRELSEYLPKQGDKLVQETPSALRLDPLGHSDPRTPETRSRVGRWDLYSDGFLEAGDRLVESLRETSADPALIYPIFYLYRHHLELELKGRTIYCLNCLSGLDASEIKVHVVKLCKTHKLQKLWGILKLQYPNHVEEMPESTQAFENLLSELDELDPDSQSARYAVDTKGNQPFLHLGCLDLAALKSGIHKMSHYLGCIHEGIGQEVDWRSEMNSW